MDEKGQGLMEYALILVIVAVGVAAVVYFYGQDLSDLYRTIINDELLPVLGK